MFRPECNLSHVPMDPILIARRSVSHVDKSTAQWTKCMSPAQPPPSPTPAVRLSDTTRTDVIWCHFKRRISFIPLFSPSLPSSMGKGSAAPRRRRSMRPPDRAREEAVSYGPFIGVLTGVVKKGPHARINRSSGDSFTGENSCMASVAVRTTNSSRVDEAAEGARAFQLSLRYAGKSTRHIVNRSAVTYSNPWIILRKNSVAFPSRIESDLRTRR